MVRSLIERIAIAAVFCGNAALAQELPPANRTQHVEITQGPELEFARDDFAILRWTTNNPGGDDDHFAVAHYGMDPKNLNQTAESHIRLNRTRADTVFRVRINGLRPEMTYYYQVTSMGADGRGDGEESPIRTFTTTALGGQIVAYPQPK